MNTYLMLQAQKKKTNHALHIVLLFVTCGMWFPIYVICGMRNAAHNQRIQDKMEGALAAQGNAGHGNNIVINNDRGA